MNPAIDPNSLVGGPRQVRSQGGIGASDAAAAIGLNPYRSPLDAWLVMTGRAKPFAGNEATFWGQALESVIRAHYIETNRVSVYVPPESIWHRSIPWLKATPDGIVVDPQSTAWKYVAPQVKSVGLRMAPAWADGVPTEYVIQGVVEMAVTELGRIDFAVLIGAQHYEQFKVHGDADLEADVLEQLASFWRCVETDTQPPIDASKTFRSHLLKQITKKQVIDASPQSVEALTRWREVARSLAQLKREEGRLKNVILAELAAANANKMTSPLGPITIGAPRRKTSWKEVATALSALPHALLECERELAALRADVSDQAGGEALVQRIESLRAQLRLVGDADYAALVKQHTSVGEPSPRRPNSWTKDLSDDDESED